ncbi:PAS domain S-box protein [Chloroflexota bacterium]
MNAIERRMILSGKTAPLVDMLDTTVTIFDQDPHTSKNLQSRLGVLGYHVLPITHSFDDAIAQITELKPKIVFFNTPPGLAEKSLDVVGGLSVLDIPMILVVDRKDKNSLDNQTQVFQFDWIIKPIIDEALQATVKLALYRHRSNKKVLDQQQQIKAIAHSTGEGFITFDIRSNIAFMNVVAEMMIGWDQDEAFGKKLSEVITIIENKDQKIIDISDLIRDRADTGPLTEFSITLMSRNGNKIPVRARVSPIRDQSGNMYGGVISFGNISELQQAVHQARLHNQRTEALIGIIAKLNSKLDLNNVLLALLEETTTITETDGALVILYDPDDETYQVVATHSLDNHLDKYKRDLFQLPELEAINLSDRAQPIRVFSDRNNPALQAFSGLLAEENINTLAMAPLHSDQKFLGVMVILSLEETRNYPEDELNFLKGLADQASLAITNARLFENVSRSRFRLQVLSKRLVEVQEAERRSLARELHDQIGQMLTGLQFSLESGKRASSNNTRPIFQESQKIISDLIIQVRDLSLRLLPSMLEDIGLLPTLEWHFERYAHQTGIQVNFSHEGLKDQRFPENIEIAAFRIVQEGLTNAARYAQVSEVNVNVRIEEPEMHLIISDEGIGFDPEKTITRKESFGLIGMRERVLVIGGKINVKSASGKGTQLKVILPLGKYIERRRHAR